MITIRHGIESDWLVLRVNGHSGTKGSSITCAGVSALVGTLAMYSLKNDGQADDGDGYANISLRNNRASREVYNAIVEGLQAISAQYPSEIHFT